MRVARVFAILFLLLGLAGPSFAARAANNKLVRVPQDAKTLALAISRVADGGVIEMAAGAYPSPGARGFEIANARKGFTVRAADRAVVAIDGGGTRALLRYANSDRARGKLVTFERIIFRNGFSAETGKSGGVTLSKSDVLFRNCTFLNNRAAAPQTGGGAVKALEGSTASFVNSSFRDNSSQLRGGAMVVRGAVVTVQGGDFTGNRVNLPGHNPNSFGGAIVVIDGTLRVTGTRFQGNEAGWVGGAIYAIGNWNKGSEVVVAGSSFLSNQAVRDLCCQAADSTTGGAIHAEDLTTLRVHQSLFNSNRAEIGGAVNNYRAVTEIYGSVFQGNQTNAGEPAGGVGGAVALLSADHSDSSTNFGAINRRSGRLVVAQSLLQGGSLAVPGRAAVSGGCIHAGGDGARQFGGGVPQAGTVAENRAQVEIRGSALVDCDAEVAPDGSGGSGGALLGDLVDLVMEDSMVLYSDARGANGVGGGVALRQDSNARIARTTFARNSAQRFGGALFLSGSTVQVADSRFYGNDVVPGVSEGFGESRGAAIFSMPQTDPNRQRNVSGLIVGSAFSDNLGIPVWEIDPPSGPINDLRYSGNRFNPVVFGDRVYVNNLAAPNGLNPGELNGFTVFRAGRPATVKTEAVPNAYQPGMREGALLAVPSPNSVGAAPTAPTASYLAYAWTGGSAQVGATGLSQKAGLLEVSPGDFTLTVDGAPVTALKVLGSCTSGPFLCLASNRFRAEVTWKSGAVSLSARAAAVSGDAGYFSFNDPGSAERVVKMVAQNGGSFGVFSGGLTNAEHTLTVTDAATGAVKTYTNAAGTFMSLGDTAAFPAARRRAAATSTFAEEEVPVPVFGEASTCAPGPNSLCLAGSRFLVELTWKDTAGRTLTGQAAPLTDTTGYFGLSSPGSVDVAVKVLDARAQNGRFWVFQGALSSVEYTVTVTDTMTGAKKTFTNPRGRFTSHGDMATFPSAR